MIMSLTGELCSFSINCTDGQILPISTKIYMYTVDSYRARVVCFAKFSDSMGQKRKNFLYVPHLRTPPNLDF